ncbi:MAG TPA: C25 family cysteine peptidase, partial [bacterium]|nr:C25 family cysteine peptidase [bacterium]
HHDVSGGLPSDVVYDVLADPAGSVWAATSSGLAVWDGVAWTTHGVADGLPGADVLCVLPLGPADVWAGTTVGLAHWDGSTWTAYTTADGLPADFITALAYDGANVWIGTLAGAARFAGGTFQVYSTQTSGIHANWIESIAADPSGRVWFAHPDNLFTQGGVSRWDGASWLTDTLPAFAGLDPRSIVAGPGPDEIWVAGPTGVFHRSASGDELLGPAEGLAGVECNAVAPGPGGDILVARADGLSVGSPGAFAVYDETNGLPLPTATWDDIDLVPDLAVGRIPASDSAEVAIYLQKLADYRAGLVTDHIERALLLGEIISPNEDGKDMCEDLATALPPSFQHVGLYESDGTENTASVRAEMDEGYAIMVHVGHGSYDVLGVGPDSPPQLLFNSHADGVSSGDRYGLMLGTNCNSGGFDHSSMMEHFLFAPDGGAVATSAATRTSVAALDALTNRDYLAEVFASADGNLALAYQSLRASLLAADPVGYQLSGWGRRIYLSRSYLGAPTLSLWRAVPTALSVAHPASITAQRAPFPVTVTGVGDGIPVADALVCVSKGDEDYAYGRTDAFGSVTFDFRPESAGTLSVTVTAPDRLPYEGSAAVLPAGVPNPVADGWQGLTAGPARTGAWPLTLALQNMGSPAASAWVVQLSCADPRVTVTAGAGALPALGTGQVGWTTPLEIDVAPTVADGEELELVLDGTGPTTFRETFRVTAEAPRLVLDAVVVSGSLMYPRLTNRGVQASGAITAALTPADGSGVVVDGSASHPSIAPGQTVTFSDGFTVTGPVAAAFDLELTD